MTAEDVNRLLAIMKANYGYAFKAMSQNEKIWLVKSWAITLADIDGDLVILAAMKLLSTAKFMPTVSEIREKVRLIGLEAECELESDKNQSVLMGEERLTEPEKMRLDDIMRRAKRVQRNASSEIPLTQLVFTEPIARIENAEFGRIEA